MIKVNVKDGQPLDDALKVFKRKCQKAKVIQDYKNKQRFEKPSDKRRRQRKERKKIARKVQRIIQSS